MKKIIVAIDGESSCGKSTLAKALAKRFELAYVDTGAMYRAVCLYSIEENLISKNHLYEEKIDRALAGGKINIRFKYNSETQKSDTFLNDKNVENEIREIAVSNLVSPIAELAYVRKKLVEMQQEMGKDGNIVMDGRDIGTVVFPNADVKFYVTADTEIRADRRYKELKAKGSSVTFDEVKANLVMRDKIDSTREIAPLKKADNAIVIDNSNLTIEQQNKLAESYILKYLEEDEG